MVTPFYLVTTPDGNFGHLYKQKHPQNNRVKIYLLDEHLKETKRTTFVNIKKLKIHGRKDEI